MAANFRLTDLPSHPRCGLSEDCPRGCAGTSPLSPSHQVWEPVIRACGDSSQTALLVSSITECAMRMGDEVDSIAGLGPSGTFWVDGA